MAEGDNQRQPETYSTDWVQTVSDEQLRRDDLAWRGSEKNRNSEPGKAYVPAISAEMERRGLKGYIGKVKTQADLDDHFKELNDILDGKAE